jgi:hypothetical protein
MAVSEVFVQTAIDLIGQIVYKPEWVFEATDHTKRYEGTVCLKITYPAQMSEREEAPAGYPTRINPYATFAIMVGDCDDAACLYRRVLDVILLIEAHEAREFMRITPTFWAPFHPHTIDGMQRWGTVEHDLTFGLA